MVITRQIAEFVIDQKWDDFPSAVKEKAKWAIVDSIGCMIGGTTTDFGKINCRYWVGLGSTGMATLIGGQRKASPAISAASNAYSANILDYDDTHTGHPGANIISTSLAVAEHENKSGADFLRAVVLGYEVGLRALQSMWPTRSQLAKIFPTTPLESIGACISASCLLGLSADQISHALGILATGAPIPRPTEKRAIRPWSKPNPAWGSLVGVTSAYFAREGITGLVDIFDDPGAYWTCIASDRYDSKMMVGGLGQDYKLLYLAFKPYPSCRWTHAPIESVLKIVGENMIRIGDVEKIEILTMSHVAETMGVEKVINMIDAQFSIPYVVAVSLLGIPPGSKWYDRDMLQNEDVSRLASKIKVLPDRQCDQVYFANNKLPARAILYSSTGKSFTAYVDEPKGEPGNPLSNFEIEKKFISLSTPVVGNGPAEGLIQGILKSEELMSIRELGFFEALNK